MEDSKVMSPEEWFNKTYPCDENGIFNHGHETLEYSKANMTLYATYVSQHSSSGSVWRKASEIELGGVRDKALLYKGNERVLYKKPWNDLCIVVTLMGGEEILVLLRDIEYLDESASRPEIKLPEKRLNISMIVDYTFEAGWNNCIEETKRLNGIK